MIPVANDAERSSLERLTSVLGGDLAQIRHALRSPEPREGEVLGLGADAAGAALFYAALTGRRARTVQSLGDETDRARPSVLLTTPRHLSPSLMEWLYSGERDTDGEHVSAAPGILCAEADDLQRMALVRAAAVSLPGPLARPRTDVLPTYPFGCVSLPGAEFVGGEARVEDIRHALGAGSGLLNVLTHSDGLDAFLGPLTLCPMDRAPQTPDPLRTPVCRGSGQCYRLHRSFREAQDSDLLLRPEAISARVLGWFSCVGGLFPGSILDPGWSLTHRLLTSDRLGAVVMPWQIESFGLDHVEELASPLRAGASVGEAVAAFNRSPTARRSGCLLSLFGDPALRLPTDHAGPGLAQAFPRPHPPDAEPEGGTPFLRAYATETRDVASGEVRTMADAALRAVEAYERVSWHGGIVEEGAASPGPRLRRAMLDLLVQRGGMIFKDWHRVAQSFERLAGDPTCHCCGARARQLRAPLRVPGGGTRYLTICPRCAVTRDGPTPEQRVRLHVRADGGIGLEGDLPRHHWDAALLFETPLRAARAHAPWPRTPTGAPRRTYRPPSPPPPGPLHLTLFVVHGSILTITRVPAFGSPEALVALADRAP